MVRSEFELTLGVVFNDEFLEIVEPVLSDDSEKFFQISLFLHLYSHQFKVGLIHKCDSNHLTWTSLRSQGTAVWKAWICEAVLSGGFGLKGVLFFLLLN